MTHVGDVSADGSSRRILCVQGDGLPRAIVSTLLAQSLEERLGQPLNQAFDQICGSLSGAIVAAALHCGQSAGEIRERLENDLARCFSTSQKLFNRWIGSQTAHLLPLRHDPHRFFEWLESTLSPEPRRGKLLLAASGACDSATVGAEETECRMPSQRYWYNDALMQTGIHVFDHPADSAELLQATRASANDARLFPPYETLVGTERWLFSNAMASPPLSSVVDFSGRETVLVVLGAGRAPAAKRLGFVSGAIGWAPVIVPIMLGASADAADRELCNIVGDDHFLKLNAAIPFWTTCPDDLRPRVLRELADRTEASLRQHERLDAMRRFVERHW